METLKAIIGWFMKPTRAKKDLALFTGIGLAGWGLWGRNGLPKQEEDVDKRLGEIEVAEPQPALEQPASDRTAPRAND